MQREERDRILSQQIVLPESPRERAQLEELEEDLKSASGRGRPLRFVLRNFRPDAGSYLLSAGGPLPYMARLREIEQLTEAHSQALGAAWDELAAVCGGDAGTFELRWRSIVERWRFDDVNDLIARHNRFYPIEARLPMDPRTRDFVRINGRDYRRRPLGPEWALGRFPAALDVTAA